MGINNIPVSVAFQSFIPFDQSEPRNGLVNDMIGWLKKNIPKL